MSRSVIHAGRPREQGLMRLVLANALAGLLVGASLTSDAEAGKNKNAAEVPTPPAAPAAPAAPAPPVDVPPGTVLAHECRALNECKGQGGCKVENQNECKGQNPCKAKGGCRVEVTLPPVPEIPAMGAQPTSDGTHLCKGMNPCKGQGGCKVENQNECKGQNPCKAKGGCSTAGGGSWGAPTP